MRGGCRVNSALPDLLPSCGGPERHESASDAHATREYAPRSVKRPFGGGLFKDAGNRRLPYVELLFFVICPHSLAGWLSLSFVENRPRPILVQLVLQVWVAGQARQKFGPSLQVAARLGLWRGPLCK
eukprot:scaffold264858_cov28-Tisochrysis_lutea.AAC.2